MDLKIDFNLILYYPISMNNEGLTSYTLWQCVFRKCSGPAMMSLRICSFEKVFNISCDVRCIFIYLFYIINLFIYLLECRKWGKLIKVHVTVQVRIFFIINLIHTSVSLATSIGTLHTDDIRTKTRLEHNNIGILISIFCKKWNLKKW